MPCMLRLDEIGTTLSLCYESVHAMCGTVAIHIAYGDVSRGKSNAVKLALAAFAAITQRDT